MLSFSEFIMTDDADDLDLFEMTGVSPKISGIGVHLWISSKGNIKHGPCVKVSNTIGKFDPIDNFSLSVDNEPQVKAGEVKLKQHELDTVKDWIRLNHKHLHAIWNSDTMDSQDHLDGLIRL